MAGVGPERRAGAAAGRRCWARRRPRRPARARAARRRAGRRSPDPSPVRATSSERERERPSRISSRTSDEGIEGLVGQRPARRDHRPSSLGARDRASGRLLHLTDPSRMKAVRTVRRSVDRAIERPIRHERTRSSRRPIGACRAATTSGVDEQDRRHRRRRHRDGIHRDRPRRGSSAGSASRCAASSAARRSGAPPGPTALGVATPTPARRDPRRPDGRRRPRHLAEPPPRPPGERRSSRPASTSCCEKPLAMTAAESAELVATRPRQAASSTRSNFNLRFYPLHQHAPRGRSRAAGWATSGSSPATTSRTGCSSTRDWNWRLEPDKGGALRAVGDIGSHWLDLMAFVTGQPIVAVMADLATFVHGAQEPTGPVETFSTERSADTVARRWRRRTSATHPAPLRQRRPRRRGRLADQRRAGRTPCSGRSTVRERRLRGTRRRRTTCGSATATGRTRSCSGTRR